MFIYTMLFNSKAYILSDNLLGIITNSSSDSNFRKGVLEKSDNIKVIEEILYEVCNENITVRFIDDLDNAVTENDKLIEKLNHLSNETDINIDIEE